MTSNPSLPPLSLSPFAVPSIPSSPPRSSPAARQLSYPTQDPSPPLRRPPSPPSTGGPPPASFVPPAAPALPRSLSGTSSLATSANDSSSTLMKSPSSELGTGYSHPPASSSGRAPNGGRLFKSRVRTSTAGRYQHNGPPLGHQHDLSDDDEEDEYDSDDELRRRAQSLGAGGREGEASYGSDDDDDLPEVIVKFSPRLAGNASSSSEDESSEDDGRSVGLDEDDDDWPSSDPLASSRGQHSTQSSADGASTGSHGERSTVKPSLSLSKIALLDEQAIATARAKILGVATTLLARPAGGEAAGGLGFGDVEDESTPRFGRSESQSSELFKAAGAGDAAADSARSLAPPAISVPQQSSMKHVPIKIAIVGRPRAGKSTLIEKAFTGWPLSPTSAVAPGVELRTARPELKSRIPQLVQLFEIDSSGLETGADGRVRMPKECGDVEALVVCFDAGDETSLGGVEGLCCLQETGIPFLVFACKAAGVPRPKEVDIAGLAAKIGRLIEVSLERDATRAQKGKGKYHQAFSFLLREAYNRRHGTYSPLPPTPNPTGDGQKIDHPAMRGPPPTLSVDTNAGLQPPVPGPALGPSSGHKPNDSESSIFSTTSQQRLADELLYHPSSSTSSLRQSKDSPANTTPGESVRGPWVVEDDGLGSQYSLPKPEWKERDRNGNLMFFTLPELLGQLWLNAFTGDLRNFHKYFFWSYRRFARPRDVLRFIGTEMTKLDNEELAGTYGQHKWCSILAWWIDNHPRDFAAAGTQVAFDDLFNVIEDRPHLAHFRDRFLPFACRLDQLVPEELPWAVADVDDELSPPAGHAPLEPDDTPYPGVGVMVSTTTTVSYAGTSASVDNLLSPVAEHSPLEAAVGSQRAASGSAPATRPVSMSPRHRHDSSTSRKSASSAGDSSTALSLEHNLAKAVSNGSGSAQTSSTSAPSLGPSSLGDPWESRALVRIVNRFNDTSDLQIANDITRLVWRYFSRIEPRDVLTHVLSGSSEGQDTPVGRAMRHFYDISAVFDDVSNLFVLLIYSQNKTKLRARMFERIIRIVHLLRTQNNYIALLAGMTALSDVWMGRLKATKELAQDALEKAGEAAVFKKFQSHFRLVENRHNYKNYRLAVKEDESAQRPAIPLMPVIIADVNRIAQTDDRRKADGAIVWSKFDKFGQVLLAMVDNQARGCPVAPGGAANVVEGMLKDKPDIDERVLYRRCDVLAAEEQSTNSISSAFRKYFPKTHD